MDRPSPRRRWWRRSLVAVSAAALVAGAFSAAPPKQVDAAPATDAGGERGVIANLWEWNWNSIAREFRRAFPEDFKSHWQRLPEGMRADLQASAETWRKYEGRLSRISEKVYSGYLKSQGISEGILSYNRLTLLVTAWKARD